MQNDHDLIRKYQEGHSAAFDELVKKYLSDTIGFFYNITTDQMTSEDLAQDVFLKLHKHLKTFRFESKFRTYLYRVNVNTANSWLTRNKWKNFLHIDQIPDRGENDTNVEDEWRKTELWNAISLLPKKQRTVMIMRIALELPYKEISEITGMTEGAAKVNYHHGLNRLKEKLEYE